MRLGEGFGQRTLAQKYWLTSHRHRGLLGGVVRSMAVVRSWCDERAVLQGPRTRLTVETDSGVATYKITSHKVLALRTCGP
jgi:hypothetical protein